MYFHWLAPRLMTTKNQAVEWACFAAEQVLPFFEEKFPNDERPRRAIEAARAWIQEPCEDNRTSTRVASAAADADAATKGKNMKNEMETINGLSLSWGEWREVSTSRGDRLLRSANPNENFWALWRERKEEIKALGISVSNYRGEWSVSQWKNVDEQERVVQSQPSEEKVAEEKVEVVLDDSISSKLFPFQIESCKNLIVALKKYNSAIDGSDLGSGKTYTAVAAAVSLKKRIAVVCPKAVIPSWYRACLHFGVQPEMVINYELVRNGKTSFAHWEGEGRKQKFVWDLPQDSIIIFDECHKMKNSKSINCKMGLAALRQGYMVEAISGTIACNPIEMRFSGEVAKLHCGADFYPWLKRVGVVKGRFGLFFRGDAESLARIHRKIYPDHGSRLRIDEIPDFPETQIQPEAYDCGDNSSKISEVYSEMFRELEEISKKEFDSAGARKGAELAAQMFARQRAEMLKVPACIEMVEDFIENGKSVVIFTNFRDSIEALSERLNTKCIVQGSQSSEERQRNVDAFQSDQSRVILVNIQSGGAGLSLHDLNGKYPRAAIIFPTWSAVDFKQATGRVHRAGGKSKSVQRVLFASGTIEDEICEKVREKLKNLSALNDADLAPAGIV